MSDNLQQHNEECKHSECATCRFSNQFVSGISLEEQLKNCYVDLTKLPKQELIAIIEYLADKNRFLEFQLKQRKCKNM